MVKTSCKIQLLLAKFGVRLQQMVEAKLRQENKSSCIEIEKVRVKLKPTDALIQLNY